MLHRAVTPQNVSLIRIELYVCESHDFESPAAMHGGLVLSSSLAKEEINIHPRESLDLHIGERERERLPLSSINTPPHQQVRLLFVVMSILFNQVVR